MIFDTNTLLIRTCNFNEILLISLMKHAVLVHLHGTTN